MPTDNDYKDALPWPEDGDPANRAKKRELRSALVKRTVYTLRDDEAPSDYVATDPDSAQIPIAIAWSRKLWWLDLDSITEADLVTVIETSDGFRYTTELVDCCIRSVLTRSITEEPDSGVEVGDAYLIPMGATGDVFGDNPNHIGYYTPRGFEAIAPRVGMWLYIEDEDLYVRYTANGEWLAGEGDRVFGELSIPLSAIINAGKFVIVQNQTTNAPPGSRINAATPTAPLGGTAANLNDNDESTTSTTAALGNLTGAAVASRIIAQLDLGSVQDLIAITATDVKCSTGSSSATATGIYTSVDGTTWTAYGAGHTLTTTATDVYRTGAVSCRYVAYVTEAKNWTTATHTLSGLNAYTDDVVGSPPTAFIVGPNPFGVLAGHSGKVAIFESENELTIYNPPEGMRAYDEDLQKDFQRRNSEWVSATGAFTINIRRILASTTWNKPDRLIGVMAHLIGPGGGSAGAAGQGAGGAASSTFAGMVAEAGTAGTNSAGGTGGIASGGDDNVTGDDGEFIANAVSTGSIGARAKSPFSTGIRGRGGRPTGSGSAGIGGGGAGGGTRKYFEESELGASEAVVIGAGGTAGPGGGGEAGQDGELVLIEYLEV